jgi:beta-galactosidase
MMRRPGRLRLGLGSGSLLVVLIFSACSGHRSRPTAAPSEWVEGVKEPVISLNGVWKFTTTPPADFWRNEVTPDDWPKIDVPGECLMQGFEIRHDVGYPYKRKIDIPADFAGRRALLRFDGVYSYARVWVNGQFVRDHYGGFTTWDCDITDLVSPGESAWLTVEVTDRLDDISYGSGYAHHLIGGILRDVWLVALPPDHITHVNIETDWDPGTRDAILKIDAGAALQDSRGGRLLFSLIDESGRRVRVGPSTMNLLPSRPAGEISCRLKSALPWNAEHPHLYTLVARLRAGGRLVEESRRRIGFRRVEVSGNRLLVNGRAVKLRGACRHDVHPLLGRRTTREIDRRDVLLAREANINFIRTSHYPPSRAFLEFCDEYGIYVEEETAVCFVGTHRLLPEYLKVSFTQDDPAFTERYLGQLREMVGRDRNHPSVIIWSIGNENLYGSNFQKEYDWLKQADPTRPVMFSYPGKVPAGVRCHDILSLHYPSYAGDLEQYGIRAQGFSAGGAEPVIYDEWAHVPCYNATTLVEDPNVRNFWGESIKKFWDATFESEAVGGAIWGMIDDVFMLPGECVGYGEWGIIDGWRRRKPEFWHVKKAYSPVRVLATSLAVPAPGQPLAISVFNRFDHTSLDELTLRWTWLGRSHAEAALPAVPPHARGEIQLPGRTWRAGDSVLLQFFRGRRFIDEELVTLGAAPSSEIQLSDQNMGHLTVERQAAGWRVSGGDVAWLISGRTGLLEAARTGGPRLIKAGPYPYLRILEAQAAWNQYRFFETDPKTWKLAQVELIQDGGQVEVRTTGSMGRFPARLRYAIEPDGGLTVDFEIDGPPPGRPTGLGLSFDLDAPAWLEWRRKGLWSVYPDGHIGRLAGNVPLCSGAVPSYREEPAGGWASDAWDFFLQGLVPPAGGAALLSNDARGLKENILRLTLGFEDSPGRLSLLANGDQAARLKAAPDGGLRLVVLTAWDYPDIDWGNFSRPFKVADHRRGRVRLLIDQGRSP